MKRKSPLGNVMIYAIIICAACTSSVKVTTDYDKATDFSKYHTFSLYKTDNISNSISQLNQQRIVSAIRAEMIKKGLTEDVSNPDLLVNPVAVFKDKVAVSSTTNYYGFGGVYRPYYYGAGASVSSNTNYNVDHYTDGSLIVDVVDAKSKLLVWQGAGNKEIDKPIKDPDTVIPKAIASILEKFPPGK